MNIFSFSEIRLIIAKSTTSNNMTLPYLNSGGIKSKFFTYRVSLIKTLKTYIKKYCQNSDKNNVLYLSILYLDIILSKNKISLSHDKNLKYLCLCCFLLSLKLVGNYDTSKKIISNFCRNYKQEYKIFEFQCLKLLEYNLVYTTSYNYLNMILIKDSKKLIPICNSLLYQICEDSIYTYYSPFYIAVAIFEMAKNSINDNTHNHYDKYFHDERVKILVKKLNYLLNQPSINPSLINDRNIQSDALNHILNKTITNTNINLITNNNIHNNIVIINTICKKKSDNHFKKDYYSNNSINTPMKISFKNKINKNNIDISNNKNKSKNILNNRKLNSIGEFKNYINFNLNISKKINSDSKSNSLYKSNLKFCQDKNECNSYNNHKTITIKETNNQKNPNYKVGSFLNNSSYLSNFNKKNYAKKPFQIKKNIIRNIAFKEESFSTDIQTPNSFKTNYINGKTNLIHGNRSSLNFQLVSGISKEKLVKLSRNLSKFLVKSNESSPNKGKENK